MIKLVSVEGLDCVGKSIFCDIIKKHLEKEVKYQYKDKVNIRVQHFPYYDCATGERIKTLLNTDGNGVDRKRLMELFVENMKEWKDEVYNKIEDNEDMLTLIICDRYMLSTHLYYLPYVDNKGSELQRVISLQERYKLIPPKLTFILEADPLLQFQRIQEKQANHPLFETIETQKLLWNNFYPIIGHYNHIAPALKIHLVTDFFVKDYTGFFGDLHKEVTDKIKEFPIWLTMTYIQYIAGGRFNPVDKNDKIMRIIFNLHRFTSAMIRHKVELKGFDF